MPGVPVLNRRQRKEMAEYRRKSSALQQEAIRGWERSFTVIAFPLPSVSPALVQALQPSLS